MERYWYWLCSCKELYREHLEKLLRIFRNPRQIFKASDTLLNKCGVLNEKQITVLQESRKAWDLEKNYHAALQSGIQFISSEHQAYPEKLKEIIDYPYGIFLKGRLPDPDHPAVAIVGARRCSAYGKHMAEEIAKVLTEHGVQIISGMAKGIDGYSQKAALEAGGSSFGILGSGVDICYPREHIGLYTGLIEQGGVISEYPPGRPPLALHFPMRNRIISALADTVLIIEAREKSGSLITADLALEQGKDIMAVPGRIGDVLSSGCNRLIGQGAGIILSPEDLINNLNLQRANHKKYIKKNILLETKEKLVYSCVDFQPRSLHDILGEIKLPTSEVLHILTTLVFKGYIMESMKNHYMKV